MEKIFYNLQNDRAYREDGSDVVNNNKPEFTYKTKRDIAVQFLNSLSKDANGDFDDFYTGWAGRTISASVAIDNNYVHYFTGILNTDLTAGTAVSTIEIKNLSGTPRIAGTIKITNATGDSENVNYNGFSESSGVYTFKTADSNYDLADFTPANSYVIDDSAKVVELPIIKTQSSDVDLTDKDTGLLVFPVDSNTLVFGSLVEGKSGLDDTNLEIQIYDSTPQLEWAKRFGILLNGLIDDDGEVGPAPEGDYYNKIETDALLDSKADKTNVLELDNTTAFTPANDYEPATKKYVDEHSSGSTPITTIDCTTADQTYAMPAIDASNDGQTYRVGKFGDYKLVIQPANTTDSIGGSGAGYGIETLDSGNAFVTLFADLANNKYHITDNSNRWGVEGLRHLVPFRTQSLRIPGDANYGRFCNYITHIVTSYNILSKIDNTALYNAIATFNGTDAYATISDPGGTCDLVASSTDSWTLSIMVKFDDASAATHEVVVRHFEDTSNYWWLQRLKTGGNITFGWIIGGTTEVSINNLAILDTAWHQIDIVKVGADVAVYLDGVFSVSATATNFKAFTGPLYFGQTGDSLNYLDGNLSDFFMVRQNLYGVDPTDSNSTVPVRIKPAKGGLIND